MKKLLKKKWLWALTAVVVIGGVFAYRAVTTKKPIEYVTEPVARGSIVQTVSATGQVTSASEIELNFKNSGQLSVVNVKTGDTVTAGQLLAQLRASDLQISIARSRATLDEALATFNKIKAGATASDIAISQAAVNKAISDRDSAKSDLESTTQTYAQNVANERSAIILDLNGALTKATISLQKIYDTLYFEGDANNLSVSNVELHQEVNSGYARGTVEVATAQQRVTAAQTSMTDTDIDLAVNASISAIQDVSATLSNLDQLLARYVIVTSKLTQADLDALKAIIYIERTLTDTSLSALQSAKSDLSDARLTYQTKVKAAQDAVKASEQKLIQAQADLTLKTTPTRPEDISLYQARVRQAQADVQLAQDRYADTVLKAPIDGVITDVNFAVGEQTSLSQPAITMLATQNYEIEVNIPESDIAKIILGEAVDITLDAFSDTQVLQGTVTTINPAQTEIQDVVYYQVTVTFNAQQPSTVTDIVGQIKPGMTANIIVHTAQKDSVLRIPYRAVKEKDGKLTVDVLQNGQSVSKPVIIGLRGDEGLVELVSGLDEGEVVITFVKQ